MSTLGLLEASSPRGLVKKAAIFTEALAEGSNTALHRDRELTTAEALADIAAFGGSYDYAANCKLSFRPNTKKKNKGFLKAFEDITGTDVVTIASAKAYLNVILHKNRHKVQNHLPKAMTRQSFVDNHCSLIKRLWRVQNRDVHVPGGLVYACQELQRAGNASLPSSVRTVEFCEDCADLLILALPKVT
jgi:hypothetical protein